MNDISTFRNSNVVDTCSLWNVLASRILHAAVKQAKITLCCTQCVRYECLFKPGQKRPERTQLQERLRRELISGEIRCCSIDLEELHDPEIQNNRNKVSKGELSSMIFARRTTQAFMTDDRRAEKLARKIMSMEYIQSTSHLIGWLYFSGALQDSDKDKIVQDLSEFNRNLQPHLDQAYQEALRCRLMSVRHPAP